MAQYELVVVVNGEATHHPITPGTEGTVIGRSRSADVRIDDPAISRRHARVYLRDGSIMVEDLGSRSGIRVQGIDTDIAKLSAGDKFAIGTYTFALADKSHAAAPALKKLPVANGLHAAPANGVQHKGGNPTSPQIAQSPQAPAATAPTPPRTPLGVGRITPADAPQTPNERPIERRKTLRIAQPKAPIGIASSSLCDATQALHDVPVERPAALRPAPPTNQANIPMRTAPQPEVSPQVVALIQSLAKRFADLEDMDRLLDEVLKVSMEAASARRASMFGPMNGASRPPVVAFQARRGGAGGPPMDKIMVRGVIESRIASLKECVGAEPNQPGIAPPPNQPKPGHLCVPLVNGPECVGAIYLDSPLPGARFGGAKLAACIEVGRVAGAAIVRTRGRKYHAAPGPVRSAQR